MKKTLFILLVLLSLLSIQSGYAQTLLLNDMYSRGVPANPDWIEIFNPTGTSVDLAGYKIYDNGGQSGSKPKKDFPAGANVPAYGFYVIVTDDTAASGFGLSSGGEKVWLENPSGVVIDSVQFAAMTETQTYGRYPDGSANLQLLNVITRGTSNGLVKMNEIYSRGTTENPDWIEIFNTSSVEVNIGGYKIYDNGGQSGSKPKKEFAAGTLVPANGFYVIVTDDTSASGFGLSSGGEKVWLEDAASVIIDSVQFTAMTETQSYGRFPDGSGNLQLLPVITRGFANSITDVKDGQPLLSDYSLSQNYPNPFNPVTSISYTIPVSGFVSLKVFNVLGREVGTVVSGMKSAGTHTVSFNASSLSSGVYFYKLTAGNFTSTRKFILNK